MGNEVSIQRNQNPAESPRTLSTTESNVSEEYPETSVAPTIGVAAVGTLTYLELRNSASPNVLIVTDANSDHGSGFCICNILENSLVCRFYSAIPHKFGSDPRTCQRRNAEFGLRLWRSKAKRACVTVYVNNTVAVSRLDKNKKNLQNDCHSEKLLFQYQSKSEHIMKAVVYLSRGNVDSFMALISALYSKCNVQFVEEDVVTNI